MYRESLPFLPEIYQILSKKFKRKPTNMTTSSPWGWEIRNQLMVTCGPGKKVGERKWHIKIAPLMQNEFFLTFPSNNLYCNLDARSEIIIKYYPFLTVSSYRL